MSLFKKKIFLPINLEKLVLQLVRELKNVLLHLA